jgi:manganese efflux pump family protein
MPLVGLLIGRQMASSFGSLGHYLGAGLLIATGAYAIWQGRSAGSRSSDDSTRGTRLIVTAFALSIDNLVVGFALSTIHVSVAAAAAIIAVVSVTMSLIGLELGERLGTIVESRSEEVGGVVLIGVGCLLGIGILG